MFVSYVLLFYVGKRPLFYRMGSFSHVMSLSQISPCLSVRCGEEQ